MNARRWRTILLLAPLAAALPACSSVEQRIVTIESRQQALQAQVADLQAAQDNIIARLVQLRQELDAALQPLRTQSADRGEDLRAMRREMTALQERYAELDARLTRLSEQIAAGGGGGGPAAPAGGPAMPPPRGARAANQPAPPPDNQALRLYNDAFNDYLRENYELCTQGFEEYIRRYGTSDRADDARYWIGQCHQAAGDTAAAREAFARLVREYPESELVPDALLNEALILEQEGRLQAALDTLRRLIQGFPTSDAAFLACGEIDKLGADKPAVCEEMR